MNHKRPSLPLIVGRKPLMEALESGTAVEKIFMLRSATGEDISAIRQIARERDIPLSQVPVEKLNGLTKAQHQGVVAYTGLLHYVTLQDAISYVVDQGNTPLLMMLDGVTDVRNVGAIARTALCCGAQAIVLPLSSSASLTEDAIKTSAGALTKIMICRVPSTAQAVEQMKLNGIQVFGTHMKASVPIFEADFSGPACIVMGAEDSGISKEVVRAADVLIKIPMAVAFDSLNVSVAAGMILYEAAKQRMAP